MGKADDPYGRRYGCAFFGLAGRANPAGSGDDGFLPGCAPARSHPGAAGCDLPSPASKPAASSRASLSSNASPQPSTPTSSSRSHHTQPDRQQANSRIRRTAVTYAVVPISRLSRSRMPDDGRVLAPEVAVFGDQVAEALARILGTDLVGVYFVGSVALGGYVPGESDIDIAAVSSAALTDPQRQSVASAVVEASAACPARGLEFTLYRREVAGSRPAGADFEVNANGGPRMPTAVHMDPASEPGFWYVLDRAIAHRSGLAISGPPAEGSSLMSLAAPFWKPWMSPWPGIALTRRRPSIRS